MKKRTLLPFIFNSELTHKLAHTTVAGVLGIIFVCVGIIGCDTGEDIVTETETEVWEMVETVEVTECYDGDHIYFEQGDTIYEGQVVEGVSANEVLVRLVDGSEKIINVDSIGGTLIADHPDLDIERVTIQIDVDEVNNIGRARLFDGKIDGKDDIDKVVPQDFGGVKVFSCTGVISAVYSDGMCKIGVWMLAGWQHRNWFRPDPKYIYFARQVQAEDILEGKIEAVIGKWMTQEQYFAWAKIMGWW